MKLKNAGEYFPQVFMAHVCLKSNISHFHIIDTKIEFDVFIFRFCFYVVVFFVIFTHDDTLNSSTFDPFRATHKMVCHFFSQVLDM